MSIKEVKDSIWEKLHDKIQQQKPEVRDKKYFILQNVLSMTSGAFFVLLILFCFSLMFFFISHNNLLLFSQFGLRGWQSLFLAFPWWLLIVALALIFLLEVLFKKYRDPDKTYQVINDELFRKAIKEWKEKTMPEIPSLR